MEAIPESRSMKIQTTPLVTRGLFAVQPRQGKVQGVHARVVPHPASGVVLVAKHSSYQVIVAPVSSTSVL